MRRSVLLVLAACASIMRVPAERFAPHPDWTPDAYRLAARPAPHHASPHDAIRRSAMIDDVAFLEHALAEAWPTQVAPTPSFAAMLRDRGREIPAIASRTLDTFCYELAEAYRSSGMVMQLDGVRCSSSRVHPEPPVRATEIPEGRNYVWHHDRGAPVGVLAINRFAPPGDPGWAHLADALRDVAATDFIVLDLQTASGDDPRVGFAVLAALGLDTFARNLPRPMTARDTPMAQVVRGNFAALHPGVMARSRSLWQGFGTTDEILAAGRAVAKVKRAAPARQIELIAGTGCAVACQMTVSLATFQNTVEVLSTTGVEDTLDGDEPGTIRLPRSGIEVTFPTVAYGTAWGGTVLAGYVANVDLLGAATERLTRLAEQRAKRAKWDAAAVPDCLELSADDAALNKKRGGCFEEGATASVIFTAMLGGERLRTFASRCGLSVDSVIEGSIDGQTIVLATGSHAAIARLAHAGFVVSIEWSCPMYPE